MSLETEERAPLLFGQITADDMRKNEVLARVVMTRVKEVCAHSKGRYTVQQVADGLAAGVCSLWGAMAPPADLRAILVTAPNEGVLDVLLAGPDIEDVTPFFSRLDGIARSERCGSLRLIGPGFWKEVLPREWRPVFTVYERTLEPRQA